MWRVVISMLGCLAWVWIAASGLIGMGYIIIAGIVIIPAALGTIHLVMTEWEEDLITGSFTEQYVPMSFEERKERRAENPSSTTEVPCTR